MTDPRSDYARTDDLDNALIPLEMLREKLGITDRALRRLLTGIERHRYGGTPFDPKHPDAPPKPGRDKAVRWGDIKHLFENE